MAGADAQKEIKGNGMRSCAHLLGFLCLKPRRSQIYYRLKVSRRFDPASMEKDHSEPLVPILRRRSSSTSSRLYDEPEGR